MARLLERVLPGGVVPRDNDEVVESDFCKLGCSSCALSCRGGDPLELATGFMSKSVNDDDDALEYVD